ncbi:hypothetical protein QEN19_003020 [Hanseniaspora menglaensis]
MNKVTTLTEKRKFQLLKNEITKLISKNENKLIFDNKLEILFNTLVDESTINNLIEKQETIQKTTTANNKSFNWSQYFQRKNNININHNYTKKTINSHREHNMTKKIADIDELELEKYEYMVFDTITETSWNLKVIDLPHLKIKRESSIFTIINENNFRDPFQVMDNIKKYTKAQDKGGNWMLFGTNNDITTQIILKRHI